MSPKHFTIREFRSLQHYPVQEPAEEWHTFGEGDEDQDAPGFFRQNFAIISMAGALLLAVLFLGWSSWAQLARVSRELDQTKLALTAANDEVDRVQARFAEASVIHNLWGLGSKFATQSAGICKSDGDKERVQTATAAAIEMWSDSDIRTEIDLEELLLPVLKTLQAQQVHVTGASLPAGVLAQYRRFRRDELGHVVMLDPSRMTDGESRAATLEFLRKLAEGQLDPSKTSVLYRRFDYGEIDYPIVQGPEDAALLEVRMSDDPQAKPATIVVAGYPCS